MSSREKRRTSSREGNQRVGLRGTRESPQLPRAGKVPLWAGLDGAEVQDIGVTWAGRQGL